MEEKLKEFKELWNKDYGYIELVLTDSEIISFITSCYSMRMAADMAADYIVSQGLGEVVE